MSLSMAGTGSGVAQHERECRFPADEASEGELLRRCKNRIGNDCAALQTAEGAGFFAFVREDAINEAAMEAVGGGCGSPGRQIESWNIHGALRRKPEHDL